MTCPGLVSSARAYQAIEFKDQLDVDGGHHRTFRLFGKREVDESPCATKRTDLLVSQRSSLQTRAAALSAHEVMLDRHRRRTADRRGDEFQTAGVRLVQEML